MTPQKRRRRLKRWIQNLPITIAWYLILLAAAAELAYALVCDP